MKMCWKWKINFGECPHWQNVRILLFLVYRNESWKILNIKYLTKNMSSGSQSSGTRRGNLLKVCGSDNFWFYLKLARCRLAKAGLSLVELYFIK